MRTLILGQETYIDDKPYLVVRIINDSTALFEGVNGKLFTVKESYVECRDPDGKPGFISLFEQLEEFTGKKSNIKALEPLIWRKKI